MRTIRQRPGPLQVHAWITRRALRRSGLTKRFRSGNCFFEGGSGPAVVLIHGIGDNAGTWSAVAPALLSRYRLLIPDLAGHGESEPATGRLSMNLFLASLKSQLLGEDDATLVGNSLGAWLAFLLAHGEPHRFRHVVAVNGGPIRGARTGLSLMPASLEEGRRLFDAIRDPSSPKLPDLVIEDAVRQARSGPIARFAAAASSAARHRLDGQLRDFEPRAGLIWGESDQLVPLEYARRMRAQLPGSTLTILPRCGHLPQQENPDDFAAALLHTLERRTQP